MANVSNGSSSLFKLEIEKGSKAYRYDVKITCKARKDFFLSKQTDIHTKNAHNLACRKIVQIAAEKTNGFGIGLDYISCYDGRTVLYVKKPIKIQNIELKQSDIKFKKLEYSIKCDLITVKISPNEKAPELDYSNFSSSLVHGNDFTTDHSVRTFLELVTSENLITSGQFQHIKSGAMFQTKPTFNTKVAYNLKPGMLLFDGIQKGVRIVDETTAFLIVDLRRSLTFSTMDRQGNRLSLADLFNQFVKSPNDENGMNGFEHHFHGVRMLISYDTSRSIVFHSLSKLPISDQSFAVNGVSVIDHFKNTYNIDLKNKYMLGAQSLDGISKNVVYPLEVLYLLPGQFIPQEKHEIALENSVKPDERYDFIMRQVELLSSGESANYLQKFGIRILKDSNAVKITHIDLPKIRFKNDSNIEKQVSVDFKGSFFKDVQMSQLLLSRNLLKNWIVVYDGDNIEEQKVNNFLENLISISNKSGFKLPQPCRKYPIELDNLEQVFMDAQNKKSQFIMFITDEAHSHPKLKLFESNYKILTQQLTSTILDAGRQTIKNIVLKMNSKCFGVNFMPVFGPTMSDLDLEKNPDLLVIGYDVAHPTHASPQELYQLRMKGYQNLTSSHPSVVGICANKNAHLGSFSGDFFYQESRREEVSANRLSESIKSIIECAYKTSKEKQRKPTRLIIIRDGLSEGQYKMAIENELEAIKLGYCNGMKAINDEKLANQVPKITFIIGTKRHNKRFFRIENGQIINTRPGDVVDTNITRKDISEFFLQSHHPIQGSAQCTQYTTLVNELNIPKVKLEQFMLLLANMHQVSGCPTSLPLPIFLADETATRGQEIYYQFNHFLSATEKPQFVRDFEKPENLYEYFDKLTTVLSYTGSKLAETRFNS